MYVALHITNSEVEQKVRKLAALTGESITGAIEGAVDQRLERVKTENKPEQETVESILALVRSFNLQRINPDLTEDEILGYGPHGYCE
jgi:antitoxin VapB